MQIRITSFFHVVNWIKKTSWTIFLLVFWAIDSFEIKTGHGTRPITSALTEVFDLCSGVKDILLEPLNQYFEYESVS